MKLKLENKTIFLDDNSQIAKKIAQGFDFSVDDDNKITVQATSVGMGNKYQLASAIQKANSVPELKVILLKLVQLLDSVV